MRVKICGITSLEDAQLAIDSGADALGFIFYEKSPRYISPSDAKAIIDKLPPFVEKVGLFVNKDASTINKIATESHITLIQLHFENSDELKAELSHPYIQVIRAQNAQQIKDLPKDTYYLIDAYCEAYGGSGKRLNLEWFDGQDCSHMILAGGLSHENVHETKAYDFYGVDVSSATEKSHGIKDPKKVKAFIHNAKYD
jgi:phosphoribosylanthranilate isomerase